MPSELISNESSELISNECRARRKRRREKLFEFACEAIVRYILPRLDSVSIFIVTLITRDGFRKATTSSIVSYSFASI